MPTLQERPTTPAPETLVTIQPRLLNPAAMMPDALEGIQKMLVAVQKGGLSPGILALTHMRASQINGCSSCKEGTIKHELRSGELDDRLLAVAAWHDSSRFAADERAALALTECMTRLDDRADAVPDDIWHAVAEHFDERGLAALVLHVALVNLFNRLNVTTRQPAGEW
jgi:alkylhydroperoxidase family enzyme